MHYLPKTLALPFLLLLSGSVSNLVAQTVLSTPSGLPADRSSEASGRIVLTANEAVAAGSYVTRDFYLGRSEYFSVEIGSDGAINYDLDIQLYTRDEASGAGTWKDYDLGVAAVTDTWSIRDISVPYFPGRMRLKFTINSGTPEITVLVNRSGAVGVQ